ncbi:MAG: UDP-2,3-diacylglucosamine diphosphatase [Chromatiales bacterium]
MAEVLFISDLHLSAERPDTVQLFLGFLAERAPRAETLYILGDLFDVWIGDDLDTPPIPQIKAALYSLSQGGTRIHLMHGNRDFLLGERFCAESGCELLPDPSLTELQGIPTLLMHGDSLCTDDLAYQAFRRQIRDPAFIEHFLSQSIPQRIATVTEFRNKSGEATSMKAEEIMDVNPQAVADSMRLHAAQRLIHGHTHRPAQHRFELDGRQVRRYVLGEWHADSARILSVDQDGWREETVSPS